jgi:hypothetical protein
MKRRGKTDWWRHSRLDMERVRLHSRSCDYRAHSDAVLEWDRAGRILNVPDMCHARASRVRVLAWWRHSANTSRNDMYM